ncbi:MAG: hypothetical protein ACRC0Y_10090, partial [Fusobacteriaceae bacterium]
ELKSVIIVMENRLEISDFLKLKPYKDNNKMIYSEIKNTKKAFELIQKLKLVISKFEKTAPFFSISTYQNEDDLKIVGTVYSEAGSKETIIMNRKDYIPCDIDILDEKTFQIDLFKAINFVKYFKDESLIIPMQLNYSGIMSACIGEMEVREKNNILNRYSQEDITNLLLNVPCRGRDLFSMLQSFPYLWKNLLEKNYSYLSTVIEFVVDHKFESIKLLEALEMVTDEHLKDSIIKEMLLCFYINKEVLKKELSQDIYKLLLNELNLNVEQELGLENYLIEEVNYGWRIAFFPDEGHDEILINSLKQVNEYMSKLN